MRKFYIFLIASFIIHAFIFALPFHINENTKQTPIALITIKNTKTKSKVLKPESKLEENKNFIAETVKQENKVNEAKKQDTFENKTISEYEIGSIEGPKIVGNFKPSYPYILKKRGIEGVVVLKLLIDENGKMLEYDVIEKTNDEFLKSVLKEIEKVSFKPAMISNVPVKSYGILKVKFKLED